MGISMSLGRAPSGSAFLISGGPPGRLRLVSDDGTTQSVVLRAAGAAAASFQLAATSTTVGPSGADVDVSATGISASSADCLIEALVGGVVVASYAFTSISRPEAQFEGRFQCRLATDPDGFDSPWGMSSSFGLYAVQGPTPASPYEPPLDRIVRFQDPIALRSLCPPIGVSVKRIRGRLADGSLVTFEVGDPLIGQPVTLGPSCKFDARDGDIAPPGFEPISDFVIRIGSAFSGASAPGLPRPDPSGPPPSGAPYADGFFRMDQMGTVKPPELGYSEADWTTRATTLSAQKLIDLNAQPAATASEVAIRNRRILEHASNISGITFVRRMLERYRGVIDRDIAITPGESMTLQAFQPLPRLQFYGEFFDFDSDCQCGTVWGTIGEV